MAGRSKKFFIFDKEAHFPLRLLVSLLSGYLQSSTSYVTMSSREFHSLTEAFGPCSSFTKANLSLLENTSMEEPCLMWWLLHKDGISGIFASVLLRALGSKRKRQLRLMQNLTCRHSGHDSEHYVTEAQHLKMHVQRA